MTRPSQPIKIIFFDIDETLYVKSKAYIPDSITQQVIPQLKEKVLSLLLQQGVTLAVFHTP
ncbi:HAD superfamily hydrolase [Actinobacillus equuli]|nr:HAD superfamily hydrolase [Actinobacillus equuli]